MLMFLIYLASYFLVGVVIAAFLRWWNGEPVEVVMLLYIVICWPLWLMALGLYYLLDGKKI